MPSRPDFFQDMSSPNPVGVGVRLQRLEKAFTGHVRDPNKVGYCASFDILKDNNYDIELLESNDYDTRYECLEHEKH